MQKDLSLPFQICSLFLSVYYLKLVRGVGFGGLQVLYSQYLMPYHSNHIYVYWYYEDLIVDDKLDLLVERGWDNVCLVDPRSSQQHSEG